jgi:RNA polymerase sigma factor (sigma-70 family)
MAIEITQQADVLDRMIAKMQQGDPTAREQLLNATCQRLLHLTRKIKRGYQRVARWEETDDVFQRAALRLYRSLEHVTINDSQHFLRLAATQIRRELIELSRSLDGPHGLDRNHATQRAVKRGEASGGEYEFEAIEATSDPQHVSEWSEFHQLIESLPEPQREVVELLWYHGMSQEEAAKTLQVAVRTVRRRWREARLVLHERLGESLPGV